MITQCLTFWGTIKFFSTVNVPFHIPTSSMRSFQVLHIHTGFFAFFFQFAIPVGVQSYLVILICIFLKINDAEHLSMCVLSIFISFLEKYLCRYLCPFFIRLFILWLLSSLYILDTSPFSDIWFASIIIFSPILWVGRWYYLQDKSF